MNPYPHVFEKLMTLNAWYGSEGEYCEPGYTSELPVLFGNWNHVSDDLRRALEEHFTLDWDDEWTSCDLCGKYFRTTADSYEWTMYGDMETCTCGDCIKEDPEPFIADLIGNPHRCARDFIDLSALGFTNLNDTFENGWHPHQTDDPTAIMAEYTEKYPDHDLVFGNFSASQFYVTFQIWGRPREEVPA